MVDIRRKRRWNSERYPKMVTVRVSDSEHQQILERASRTRLSSSRFLVRAGLAQRFPPIRDRAVPSEEERRELEFLLFELRKIGVNLNQIARDTNLARLLGRRIPRSNIEQAAQMVQGLVKLICRRL